MTDIFTRLLLPMGLAGGLGWLLLLPLRPLLSKLRACWRKGLLLACATLFILPLPLLLQPGSAAQDAAAQALGSGTPASPVYSAGVALAHAAGDSAPTHEASTQPENNFKSSKVSWLTLFSCLYWTGAAVALGLSMGRHHHLMHQLNALCVPVPEGSTMEEYRKACAELGMANPPKLYQCGGLSSPILAGVLNSRIILPDADMTLTQLRFALLHELQHHRSRDLLFKYLMLGVGVLHWYNPAAHLLRREFSASCEQSCDEAVSQYLTGAQRKQYAAVLLNFAGPDPGALVSAFASPAKGLRTRLHLLMQPANPGKARNAAGVIFPALVFSAALLAGCSLAAGTASSPGDDAPPPLPNSVASSLPSSVSASLPADDNSLSGSGSKDTEKPGEPALIPADTSGNPLQNPVPDALFSSRGFKDGGHRGMDFNGEIGTNIYAAGDGTVTVSGWHDSYGNYIVIDHSDGLQTLYAHNQELLAAVGQQVNAGDLIATMGTSGMTSGSVCHVEVSQGDSLLDPEDYIQLPAEFLARKP